jgi:hypothetical protein
MAKIKIKKCGISQAGNFTQRAPVRVRLLTFQHSDPIKMMQTPQKQRQQAENFEEVVTFRPVEDLQTAGN